ncbi:MULTISPECIES: hypothetical protein [Crocosphaera]|uniref:Uncharacterized protein n=3 Tax=Crocosphaera watsonii TaxID=263511 RepID=T2JLJ4_CROWT|nr:MULTISPECIES: hypothetical protein [Crocosphaera]EHJ11348.1 hypothetical protein CWATWH0003_3910 [Crocosphaera watsonii WH 0003]MCH2245471.1 hypothetical protein [Crocosphaera sp.]CCQ55339.1 hypothetical protein CWATWH0005_4089 [Crocosphaera watsonii WH 0005]CCQ65946.1 hypothetical protein CWATWH0402_500 [Crocosphaera watsonii WH 0402]
MNATTHAISFELTRKIAQIGVLFRAEFPEADVDLNPWLTDADTQCLVDPYSIDLSFYFPRHHSALECHCILLEVKFTKSLMHPNSQLNEIKAHGFYYGQLQWSFDTDTGDFSGDVLPDYQVQAIFTGVTANIFQLFDCSIVNR